jgi:hypothetical protein
VALNMGQWAVPGGTAPTPLFNIPPGPYNMTIYNTFVSTVWLAVGTSSTVVPAPFAATTPTQSASLSTVWLSMHSIPTSFSGYQGAGGGYLWGMSTATTAVTTYFNYILATQER